LKKITSEPITLLDALKQMYPDTSISKLRNFLKNKFVSIDGTIAIKANILLSENQEILVSKKSFTDKIPYGVKILYNDPHLLIISKPEVLLSLPLDKGLAPNALKILQTHFHTKSIFAVHRIDKETSGIMVFAKTLKTKELLNKMFKKHDLKRQYLAIVQGYVKENKGIWKSNLLERNEFEVVESNDSGVGKEAITYFEVIKRTKMFSFLKLTLHTGKKHQIRVHCANFGHPIAGDKRYGNIECDPISRICLHAKILEFVHPITKEKISYSAPVPRHFAKLGI